MARRLTVGLFILVIISARIILHNDDMEPIATIVSINIIIQNFIFIIKIIPVTTSKELSLDPR